MQRNLPKLYGNRPIDAPSPHASPQGLIMSRKEVEAAICHPPCTCADCEQGFYNADEQLQPGYWYRRSLSSSEAKQIAALYIKSMHKDREYLVERLATYGDIIVNRWKKKSQDKRESLLLEAIPNLCEKRWIIPRHIFTPEGKQIPPINSEGNMEIRSLQTRHHLLLHWFSLEVLKTNPAVLFALLHNRTAFAPQDWAAFDARQLNLPFLAGHFDVDFSDKCVVMYGLAYGDVVDWQAGPAHRADVLGFPKARLVLEAQAYLMSSLRKTVDAILQGIDTSASPAAEKWKSMVSLGFRHSNVVELWSPYTNQAFSSPPLFSINNLIAIAQIRLEATIDHLWLLQTEPAYMKRFIANICHGGVYESTKDLGAGWLVANGIIEAIQSCWRWDRIKNECEYVKRIHDRFRDNIAQGENLPTKYDKSLGALELLIVNEVNNRAALLGKRITQSPGFSYNYITTRSPQAQGPDVIKTQRKGGLVSDDKYLYENDPLDYCIHQLQVKPDMQEPGEVQRRIPFDHAMIFSLIEHHLAKSNSKEKSRVDEILSSMLSDLAACHEMLVAIRLHRPQSHARTLDEVLQSENRKVWKVFTMKEHFTEKSMQVGKVFLKDFYEVQSPTGQKDMTWLKHSRSIRRALETFWQGIRNDCTMVWKDNGFNEDEIADELEYISATRTDEYLNAIRAEDQELLATIEHIQKHKRNQPQTTTRTQTVWGPEEAAPILVPPTKQKEKTRPAEHSSSTTIEEIDHHLTNATISPSPRHQIPVKKRAYHMLTHMYPSNAEDASSKQLDWDTFVHAMSDLGFCARNKGGSAVGFEKEVVRAGEEGLRCGSIIFHRPHPETKIDPVMMRCMGRRMTRRFGWWRGLFCEGVVVREAE